MKQIHDQKGEIVQNIDVAQTVIEFDAVKQDGLPVEKENIPKMQIPMALPNEIVFCALFDIGAAKCKRALCTCNQFLDFTRTKDRFKLG